MILAVALLMCLDLLVKICDGRTVVKYFSTKYCVDEPYKIAHMDVYYLKWEGQRHPNLCKLTFIRGWKAAEICFRSKVYDITKLNMGVGVRITNDSKGTWSYDRYDHKIPRTCVRHASKLVFSIIIPPAFEEPEEDMYIELKIDAVKDKDADDEDEYAAIPSTILGFIAFAILACLFGKKGRVNVDGVCQCCGEVICYFVQCQCLPKCDAPSCNCDICNADGECCIACPGCCTQVIVRERPDNTNEIPEESTPMADVSEESVNINVSTSESGMTGSSVARGITDDAPPTYASAVTAVIVSERPDNTNEILEESVPMAASGMTESSLPECPPPSYQSAVRDLTVAIYRDPTLPPPNYEEVISQV